MTVLEKLNYGGRAELYKALYHQGYAEVTQTHGKHFFARRGPKCTPSTRKGTLNRYDFIPERLCGERTKERMGFRITGFIVLILKGHCVSYLERTTVSNNVASSD